MSKRDEGMIAGAEDRAIGAAYEVPDETLGAEYAQGYYMGFYKEFSGQVITAKAQPIAAKHCDYHGAPHWDGSPPCPPPAKERASAVIDWSPSKRHNSDGTVNCWNKEFHASHVYKEAYTPKGGSRMEYEWTCPGVKNCANCGRPDDEKPLVFRGTPHCSVDCQKALAEKSSVDNGMPF